MWHSNVCTPDIQNLVCTHLCLFNFPVVTRATRLSIWPIITENVRTIASPPVGNMSEYRPFFLAQRRRMPSFLSVVSISSLRSRWREGIVIFPTITYVELSSKIRNSATDTRSPSQPFITQGIRESQIYTLQTKQIYSALETLLNSLNEYSVPFYSPRYSAHMCVDQSMPAILGYLATMFYNPNNVAFEASPFTTLIELEVGRQLCEMLGFNTDASVEYMPLSWGHITCDGSVANLESIWYVPTVSR